MENYGKSRLPPFEEETSRAPCVANTSSGKTCADAADIVDTKSLENETYVDAEDLSVGGLIVVREI